MTERIKFYVFLSVFILVTGWWLLADIWRNGGQIRAYGKELARLDRESQELLQLMENHADLKQSYGSTLIQFDSLRVKIPDRDSYVKVLENIREIARMQNIEIVTFSPLREDSYPGIKHKLRLTGKYIERYPVQLRIFADFLTIGVFLEELLAMSSIINIGRINLETELGAEGVLVCELLLYTYNLVDKEKVTT